MKAKPTFQDVLLGLQEYWAKKGCIIWQPHHTYGWWLNSPWLVSCVLQITFSLETSECPLLPTSLVVLALPCTVSLGAAGIMAGNTWPFTLWRE